MTNQRLFRLTLLLVLWYFLSGLVFSRVLALWPSGYEAQGFFLIAAALPWSLLAIEFYAPTDSVLGAAVRDLLFLLLLAFGIAVNAVVAATLVRALLKQARLRLRLRRIDRDLMARRPRHADHPRR